MTHEPPRGWRRRFGGIEWQVTADGILTRQDGGQVLRTAGDPVTMRRLLATWGPKLRNVSIMTSVPLPLLMMTVVTEGGLQWRADHFIYPPHRIEPGYTSDRETPHRISLGPMHVLLSTYRQVMRSPSAPRAEATFLTNNLAAGALFIYERRAVHEWDPVLVAASYNAGGVYDASDPDSRFHNRWCIRCHVAGSYVHLDRAARWYGDACAVLAEETRSAPPIREISI